MPTLYDDLSERILTPLLGMLRTSKSFDIGMITEYRHGSNAFAEIKRRHNPFKFLTEVTVDVPDLGLECYRCV